MTLPETIERKVRDAQSLDQYRGFDWWQVSPEEEQVFAIALDRWPRMMTALAAFDTVIGSVHPDEFGFDAEAVAAVQGEFQASQADFTRFATEHAGMTSREALQAYAKNKFWLLRAGTLKFTDEP